MSGNPVHRFSFLPQAELQTIRHDFGLDVPHLRNGSLFSACQPSVKKQKLYIPRPCVYRHHFSRRICFRRFAASKRPLSLELRKVQMEYRQSHPSGLCSLLVSFGTAVRKTAYGKRQTLQPALVYCIIHFQPNER